VQQPGGDKSSSKKRVVRSGLAKVDKNLNLYDFTTIAGGAFIRV
jgi:hypothetical protein